MFHGFLENAAIMATMVSLAYAPVHCYSTVGRRSVGMLWRVSTLAIDAVSPSGQPLLLVAFGCGHVWVINHMGVDSTQ